MTWASNSSIWKGVSTAAASEPDPLEDALAELVRAAQEDLYSFGSVKRVSSPKDKGELMVWPDRISYVLVAPGLDEDDLFVRAAEGELRVDATGLEVRRRIGFAVDPDSLEFWYNNGVLSVSIPRR